MPFVHVAGMQYHYEDDAFTDPWKTAEVVLIQHGWGRSSRFFYHWVPALARDYRVIRRDMRGHGLSDDPPAGREWTVDELLDDMIGFLDALGLDQVHYIGESAGGVLGAALAARNGDRLKSLTMISSPLSDPTRASKQYGYDSLSEVVARMPIRELVKLHIEKGAVVPLNSAHEAWMLEEWARNRSESLAGLARLFPALDLTPLLPSIRVPTLILAPGNSATAPLSHQHRMSEMIAGSQIQVIDGSGHELYFEKADECLGAIKAFLGHVGQRQ